MKTISSLLWVLLLFLTGALQAQMVAVSKTKAPAPIIVYKDAPVRTLDAAVTLADYIEKISGQRPEVINGFSGKLPDRAIWIGVHPSLETLFPKTDFSFNHPEETLIRANGNHLVLAGRDLWNPNFMEQKGRLAMKTGIQQEYGTANAIYTFIQNHLGVRWLWPEEEDVIKDSAIVLGELNERYHPQLRSRSGMFQKLSLGSSRESSDKLWSRLQRVQLDSMEMTGGHGFGHWWAKYGKTHPDYFAQAPDGTRPPVKFNPKNTKLCATNPGVWERWLEETSEHLKNDPIVRVFNVSPNDGYTSGHCTCEKCLAWDHPDGEKVQWVFPGGVKYQGVAQTDRDVRFANTLGRMLKERFPDRELYVQLNAYGLARNAPIGVKPDDNVIISSVANFSMRSPGDRKIPLEQHAAWGKVAKHLMWRPNLGSQAGLGWGMPDVAITQAGEDFRFVAKHRAMGLFFDLFWFHWSTQGPHYYALARLSWNPHVDVEVIMDDYYHRAFGPAADDLKAYWKLLEKTRMEFVAEEPSRQRAFDIPKKYTPELLARAQAYLDAAKAKTRDADEKYQRRLDFVQCGLDFTKLVVDTRVQMQKFEASKLKDLGAKQKVLANWDKAMEMKKTFPKYAINWQAVFREPEPDKKTKRTMGLHPDVPLSGRVLRELRAVGLE